MTSTARLHQDWTWNCPQTDPDQQRQHQQQQHQQRQHRHRPHHYRDHDHDVHQQQLNDALSFSALDPSADFYPPPPPPPPTSGQQPLDEYRTWMNDAHHPEQYPPVWVQRPTANDLDNQLFSFGSLQQPSTPSLYDHQLPTLQSPSASSSSGSRHERHTSESTIASTTPNTPFVQYTPFPFVAGNGKAPATIVHHNTINLVDWAHHQPQPSPSHHHHRRRFHPSPHISIAHAALKDMAMDQHTSSSTTLEEVPDLFSSRRSNSSHGQNTPNTPSGDESDSRPTKMTGNEPPQRGHLELYRTESAVFQDELFNPQDFSTSASRPSSQATPQSQPRSTKKNQLNPHANLVNEIVGKANQNRSRSPHLSREKSPFRKQSEHYPRTPAGIMPSAARIRQQQKEEADQKEFEAHQPTLRREPTQTMSPKDAIKDYDETKSMSLFTDIIPEGYEKHLGGTETFSDNFVSGTNQAYGQFVPVNSASNVGGFRGVDLNNFLHSPMENATSDATSYVNQPFASQRPDKTPEFPAHLTSMESSASEPMPASQESNASPVQRPANTSADTGTYTCTYHGCTQRFETPVKLQRHKREQHQSQSGSLHASSSSPSSTSPEADTPGGDGMTSAALRNTQAGPHKCNRINPITGKPCNTIFSRPYDLTRHEDTIHNKGKQKVRCQYCREEKTFSRNDALTRHMRVVHPDVDLQGKRLRGPF